MSEISSQISSYWQFVWRLCDGCEVCMPQAGSDARPYFPLLVLTSCPFVLVLPSCLSVWVSVLSNCLYFLSQQNWQAHSIADFHPSALLAAARGCSWGSAPGTRPNVWTSDWRACREADRRPKSSPERTKGPAHRTGCQRKQSWEAGETGRHCLVLFLLLTGGTPHSLEHRPLFRWTRDTLQEH